MKALPGSTCIQSLSVLTQKFALATCIGLPAPTAGNPKFKAVYNNITADGAKLVLLLRLSPLVPFNLLNYGLGESTPVHSLCSRLQSLHHVTLYALAARLE